MAETPSPSQVVGELVECLATRQFDRAADLYAQDCLLFLPLAQPAGPTLVGGAAVRELVKADDSPMYVDIHVRDLKIRTTGDPEVVIAEWDFHGTSPATGKPFETGNLLVARVRDGKIVSCRDYHDPVTRAWAAGALDELLAELKGATANV